MKNLLILLVVCSCLHLVSVDASGQSTNTGYRVIVKFKPGQVGKHISKKDINNLDAVVAALSLPKNAVIKESAYARWVRRECRKKGLSDPGIDWKRLMYLQLPPGVTPDQCAELLKNNPMIEYVTKGSVGTGGAVCPDDEHYGMHQWYLAGVMGAIGRISIPEAWEITTGSSNIIVAVLDTGCDTNNVNEFLGRVVPGFDFVNDDPDPMDDHGHGTQVASVLCASGSNGAYGAGIDWNCRLMPVKILDAGNSGTPVDCIDGIDWAVVNGAKIINLSAGGWTGSETNDIRNAITNAIANGVIFITITHNSTIYGSMPFPGTMPEVITVGASDTNGQRCGFSLYGPTIDLVAPGTNMYLLTTNSAYLFGPSFWGTSYAAPQVAGVAALICSIRPELNNQQVADLLCAGAVNPLYPANGWDNLQGWGVLNAFNSLLLAGTSIGDVSVTNDGAISLSWGSPPNASNRHPFNVEYTVALTGAWTTVSNVGYGADNATWSDMESTNSIKRFYRVKVRQF